MPSRKAKKPNHLPDGRHVATVSSDELWGLYRSGRAAEAMVQRELIFRGDPVPRAYSRDYVPFSGGARAGMKLDTSTARPKRDKPDRPSNVKDTKKDKKKNEERT